jgi:hypothetical protein
MAHARLLHSQFVKEQAAGLMREKKEDQDGYCLADEDSDSEVTPNRSQIRL